MKLYYVVEKDDNDWDLDATPNYFSRDEAEAVKKEMEETYNTEYVIWGVD